MSRNSKLYLTDMKEALENIEGYVKGKTREEFKASKLLRDAVIRNLEVIGEASKSLPLQLKRSHPDIEWKKNQRAQGYIDT